MENRDTNIYNLPAFISVLFSTRELFSLQNVYVSFFKEINDKTVLCESEGGDCWINFTRNISFNVGREATMTEICIKIDSRTTEQLSLILF